MADAHRMGSGSDQFFLAAGVQRELGERNWSQTAHGAGLALSGRLFDLSSVSDLLANALCSEAMAGKVQFGEASLRKSNSLVSYPFSACIEFVPGFSSRRIVI